MSRFSPCIEYRYASGASTLCGAVGHLAHNIDLLYSGVTIQLLMLDHLHSNKTSFSFPSTFTLYPSLRPNSQIFSSWRQTFHSSVFFAATPRWENKSRYPTLRWPKALLVLSKNHRVCSPTSAETSTTLRSRKSSFTTTWNLTGAL